MAEDVSRQLQMQLQLQKVVGDTNKLLEKQLKLIQGQASAMTTTMQSLQRSTTTFTQSQRNMSEAAKDAEESLEDQKDAAEELADALGSAAEKSYLWAKGFDTIKSVLGGAVGLFGSLTKTVFGFAGSLAKAAISVFAFPFKMFNSFVEEAANRGVPLAEAYEKVRKTFGDLASGPGQAVIKTFRNATSAVAGFAGTGLSVSSIFGYGPEGMAKMLEDINELAAAMGDQFHRLQGDFQQMGAKSIIFQRGLGMTKDEFGELASIAKNQGKDLETYMTDFGSAALSSAEEFGLGVKDVSKGMKDLSKDVTNFGHLGPRSFAPITVYARKLGLEIKDMAGVMGKFAGFSETAESAARMSQAFGMNVDAMKLMAAQNPAEKIDMLRKSFFATGKDLKSFTYQQRQYLSQLTGLEGKSLDAAFALEQQGLSYSDIEKRAKSAQKQQKTQKQILGDLSKGIAKLVHALKGSGGFMDRFFQGFRKGFMHAGQTQNALLNIDKGLRAMRDAGISVGKAFVETFPGVKDMLQSISDLLKPKNFKKFTETLKGSFKMFFKDLGDPKKSKDAFSNLFKNLSKGLNLGNNKSINKFLEGLKAFGRGISAGIASFIRMILDQLLRPMIDWMTELLTEASSAASKKDGWGAKIGAAFGVILDEIDKKLGTSKIGKFISDMLEPLGKLFSGDDKSVNAFFDSLDKNVTKLKEVLLNPLISVFKDPGFLSAVGLAGAAFGAAALLAMRGLPPRGPRGGGPGGVVAPPGGTKPGQKPQTRMQKAKARGGRMLNRAGKFAMGASLLQMFGLAPNLGDEGVGGAVQNVIDYGSLAYMAKTMLPSRTAKNVTTAASQATVKTTQAAQKGVNAALNKPTSMVTKVGGKALKVVSKGFWPLGAILSVWDGASKTVDQVGKMKEAGISPTAVEQATAFFASTINSFTLGLIPGLSDSFNKYNEFLRASANNLSINNKNLLEAATGAAEIKKTGMLRADKALNAIFDKVELSRTGDLKLKEGVEGNIENLLENYKVWSRDKAWKKMLSDENNAFAKRWKELYAQGGKAGELAQKQKDLWMAQNRNTWNRQSLIAELENKKEQKMDKLLEERKQAKAAKTAAEKVKSNKVEEIVKKVAQGSAASAAKQLAALNKVRKGASNIIKKINKDKNLSPDMIAEAQVKIDSVKKPIETLAQVNVMLADFVKVSKEMEDKVGSKPVKRAVAVLKSLGAEAKGGSIKVFHNLNNRDIKMAVTINLDAETVGRQIVKHDLSDKTGKDACYVQGDTQYDSRFGPGPV